MNVESILYFVSSRDVAVSGVSLPKNSAKNTIDLCPFIFMEQKYIFVLFEPHLTQYYVKCAL